MLSGCGDGSWYIHDTFNLTGEIDHMKKCVVQCPRRIGHTKSIGTAEWLGQLVNGRRKEYPNLTLSFFLPFRYPVDNGMFVTSSSDGTLCVWDANSAQRPVDKYDLEEVITRHQINPCSGTLIAGKARDRLAKVKVVINNDTMVF